MRTTLLPFLCALLTLAGTPAFGGESLDIILQKRTLDLDVPKETTLSGALSELAARYKAKYGDELPVFVSVTLLPNPSEPKPVRAPTIPGTDPPEPLKLDPSKTRLGGRLHNVPIIEILRYYANISNADYTVRGDVILFHKPK